jgi:hypothetical protein
VNGGLSSKVWPVLLFELFVYSNYIIIVHIIILLLMFFIHLNFFNFNAFFFYNYVGAPITFDSCADVEGSSNSCLDPANMGGGPRWKPSESDHFGSTKSIE